MGSELAEVDGYCFLLITTGLGDGDRESPLIKAGYRLAEEEQQEGHKGSRRAKLKVLECGRTERQSSAAIPDTDN